MKRNFIALVIIFGILVCGISVVNAKEKEINNPSIVDVTVEGTNIKFEKGTSNSIETEYYGTASSANHNLVKKMDGNTYKITLDYTGGGISPSIKEGGVIVKIPDDTFSLLCVNGKTGSGIVMDYINVDTDITSESCAVIIHDENGDNEININSSYDSYKIFSAPISKDFTIKAVGSDVKFTFTKQPSNLKFQLTEENCYIELPAKWRHDYSIGRGRPKMIVEVESSVFNLSIDN